MFMLISWHGPGQIPGIPILRDQLEENKWPKMLKLERKPKLHRNQGKIWVVCDMGWGDSKSHMLLRGCISWSQRSFHWIWQHGGFLWLWVISVQFCGEKPYWNDIIDWRLNEIHYSAVLEVIASVVSKEIKIKSIKIIKEEVELTSICRWHGCEFTKSNGFK